METLIAVLLFLNLLAPAPTSARPAARTPGYDYDDGFGAGAFARGFQRALERRGRRW